MRLLTLVLLVVIAIIGSIKLFSPLSQRELMTKMNASVVSITAPEIHKHVGTGFAIKGSANTDFILTNRHVCEGAKNEAGIVRIVVNNDGQTQYFRKIVKISDKVDLCLIEGIKELKPIMFGNEVSYTDTIHVLGFPLVRQPRVSSGMALKPIEVEVAEPVMDPAQCKGKLQSVLFMTLCITTVHGIEVTAQAFPGNSGSPVVNIYGQLVGVIFAGDSQMNSGLYVPMSEVIEFLK